MQKLLNPSEVALIDARLHDNALLEVCRKIWPERQEEITSVMVRAEDIFYESAWLMDELIEADADTDVMSLTRGLWSTLINDIGYWTNGVSRNDRYLIASTVFRLVAAAFSLHWHSYYCDNCVTHCSLWLKKNTHRQKIYTNDKSRNDSRKICLTLSLLVLHPSMTG